jgi:amidohydrolase
VTVLPSAAIEAARSAAVAAIVAAAADLVALSRFVHDHPEVAMQERLASAAAADFLAGRGFAVERGVAGLPTAFEASAGDGSPRVAFLAEYDPLPGLGHGCCHNLICLAGVGAGLGLAAALPHLPAGAGGVVVFGTPAQEAIGGKVLVVEAGLFADVDAARGAHPGTSEAACPTVEGSGRARACQAVRIAIQGTAAHAAADPYNGVNALRQHVRSDARIHGIVTDGGDAPNVVPAFAAGDFLVRAETRAYMDELVGKVRRVAEGAAMITGARLEFSLPEPASADMVTNHTLAARVKRHLDRVGLRLPEAKAEPASGSTDWGNVSYVVPSVETGYPILNRVCTWHSAEVVAAADSPLGYANTIAVAKALALTGVDVVADPSLLAEVRGEFDRAVAARA